MTSTPQAEQRQEELSQAERLAVRVRQQVLQALGTPPGWHRVSVRPLWGSHFRVNVLVGEDATSFTIRHSFFLLTDGGGNVLEASPGILPRYPHPEGEGVSPRGPGRVEGGSLSGPRTS